MRAFIWFAACLAIACSHHGGGADSPDAEVKPPMPDAWQIQVASTGLDRFLDVAAHADHQWHVAGAVTASKGVASLDVNGGAVTLGDGGSFAADVKVGDGVTRVPILASDVAGDQ